MLILVSTSPLVSMALWMEVAEEEVFGSGFGSKVPV